MAPRRRHRPAEHGPIVTVGSTPARGMRETAGEPTPRSADTPIPSPMRLQLRDESGVTLVMAVCIMSVLSRLAPRSSSTRTRTRGTPSTRPTTRGRSIVAEAGMNYARSMLWNAADPTQANAVPARLGHARGRHRRVLRDVRRGDEDLDADGYRDVRESDRAVAPVTRSVSSDVRSSSARAAHRLCGATTSRTRSRAASRSRTTRASALRSTSGATSASRTTRTSPALRFKVGGTLTVGNNGSRRLRRHPDREPVNVAGRVHRWRRRTRIHACPGRRRGLRRERRHHAERDDPTKPTVDLAYWYQNASPGPLNRLHVGQRSRRLRQRNGWNNRSAQPEPEPSDLRSHTWLRLQLQDGHGRVELDAGEPWDARHQRDDLLRRQHLHVEQRERRVSGTCNDLRIRSVTLNNNAKLCGISGCTASWNTNTNYLVFVVGGPTGTTFTISNNGVYQGGAYVVADYDAREQRGELGPGRREPARHRQQLGVVHPAHVTAARSPGLYRRRPDAPERAGQLPLELSAVLTALSTRRTSTSSSPTPSRCWTRRGRRSSRASRSGRPSRTPTSHTCRRGSSARRRR